MSIYKTLQLMNTFSAHVVSMQIIAVTFFAPLSASAATGAFFSPIFPAPAVNGEVAQKPNDIAVPYSLYAATAGDLGKDGISEIVVSGSDGKIHALRSDGTEIFTIDMPGGGAASLAVFDDNGDKKGDIAVGDASGGDGLVTMFIDNKMHRMFSPYGKFPGGIAVAGGDVDGDGKNELITIPLGGGSSHMKVWNRDGSLRSEKIIFDHTYDAGSHIAAGDVDGDGSAEIIVTKRKGAGEIIILDGQSLEKRTSFTAIDGGFKGGLNIAVQDISKDGIAEIIAVPETGGGPHVHVFSGEGKKITAFFGREESYRGATLLAAGVFNGKYILTFSGETHIPRHDLSQHIIVDYSEQRLYAYEYGKLINTFLVSTGRDRTTPMGDFPIMAKPYIVHYAGPGYDMGRIPYNLRFYPHIYIHYAPWHNNFGRPWSRGCVNVNLENAEWIYNWAQVGSLISVVE